MTRVASNSMTSALMVLTAITIVGMSRSAMAQSHFCAGSPTFVCDPPITADPQPNWQIRIGSDDEGQWVAWIWPDGHCEWELIDPPSGLTGDLLVRGASSNDQIVEMVSTGISICGFPLRPPINNGFVISMEGFGGGRDTLMSNTGPSMMCGYRCDSSAEAGFNSLVTHDPSAFLVGGDGDDLLFLQSGVTPSGIIMFGEGGNDKIDMAKRGTNFVDCGAGADSYCGPSARLPTGCETTNTICNTF